MPGRPFNVGPLCGSQRLMSPSLHHRHAKAGFTLTDLLVVISGVVPALWVSSYVHGSWQRPMVYVLTFVFGISFWCVLFLWLLPLLERHRKTDAHSDDGNPPAA